MSAPPTALPELLDVPAVMARYGLRDRRSARRLMDEANGFVIAGRLVVSVADLAAHEERLRAARRAPQRPQEAPGARGRGRTFPGASKGARRPLAPGWWRQDCEEPS